MRAEITNRIVFVLACVGVAVALIIGLAHATDAQLPCGAAQAGCNEVAKAENSKIAGIPIAFFGAGLYFLVALAALARAVIGPERAVNLTGAIWFLLATGTVISMVLMGIMTHQIQATCAWCVASAAIMAGAFLTHSIGIMRPPSAPPRRWPFGYYAGILAFFVAAGGAYGGFLAQQARALVAGVVELREDTPVYLERNFAKGSPDTGITIVQFSDMYCPTCRTQHFWLEEALAEGLDQDARVVYRHFPIHQLHPLATTAAMFGEWAGDNGKFWEFVDAVSTIRDIRSIEALIATIEDLGLDLDEAAELLNDPSLREPYLRRVQEDITDGIALGVEATPHWFIIYPDGKTVFAVGEEIRRQIRGAEFRSYVERAAR